MRIWCHGIDVLVRKANTPVVKPDPDKVARICNMPVSTTKEKVLRGLDMGYYMATFVPSLTVKTTALRQLLPEKNDWQWEAEQAKELQDISS